MMKKILLMTMMVLLLSSCATVPPDNMHNACSIFKQYPKWYKVTKRSHDHWGIPVHVQMAIMHQESHFKSHVKPDRTKLFGFIPWKRPTSAHGYSQALDGTWKAYKKECGKFFVSRTNFADCADFMGWYLSKAAKELHLSKNNTYALYLAYHEGIGGYKNKTYQRKPWLKKVAKKVSLQSHRYKYQLMRCKHV